MKIFYEGHHLTNIADFATEGEAIALLTNGQTRFARNPKIKILPINPPIEININLVYPKGRCLNKAGTLMVENVKNYLEKHKGESLGIEDWGIDIP